MMKEWLYKLGYKIVARLRKFYGIPSISKNIASGFESGFLSAYKKPMSILIKGMERPKSCTYCPMLEGDRDDGLCHAASKWLDDEDYWLWYQYPEGDIDTSKPINCPLIPVPPHGDLIDRDALNHKIYREIPFKVFKNVGRVSDMVLLVCDAPTIIEAEEGET